MASGCGGRSAGLQRRMHLLYVDESGDTGRQRSGTSTFILSGLMVHHAEWHATQAAIHRMRQRLHAKYAYPPHAEMHASEMLGRSEEHHGARRNQRIQAILHAVEMIRCEQRLTALRVIIDKQRCPGDIGQTAWTSLLHAAATQIGSNQGHRLCSAAGLVVVCDDHRTAPSSSWLGEIRSRLPIESLLVDEPFGRDSSQSALLQLCDLLAYLTKQHLEPNLLFRRPHARGILARSERLFQERGVTLRPNEEGGAFAPP